MNWLNTLKLKKEANLLDSKLFIVKTFFAIATGYIVMSHVPFVNKDLISVLFGLVLTLEPVNLTGIKNGWEQVFASFMGAISTAIIMYLFGINAFTIGLSVAFTLYVCLLMNWRGVSPFALFTAIYMTQYLQLGPDGQPSILLTMGLRFSALVSGVLIAIVFNYIFSIIQYRLITNKRSIYLMKQLLLNLDQTQKSVKSRNQEAVKQVNKDVKETEKNIDWVFSLFSDIKKEVSVQSRLFVANESLLDTRIAVLQHLKLISHLILDITYVFGERLSEPSEFEEVYEYVDEAMTMIMDNLGHVKDIFEAEEGTLKIQHDWLNLPEKIFKSGSSYRIYQDLIDINKNIKSIVTLSEQK